VVGRLCCVSKLTVWPAHFSDASAAYAVNRALVIIYRAGYDGQKATASGEAHSVAVRASLLSVGIRSSLITVASAERFPAETTRKAVGGRRPNIIRSGRGRPRRPPWP